MTHLFRFLLLILASFFFFCLSAEANNNNSQVTTTKRFLASDWDVVGDGIHDDTAAMRHLLAMANDCDCHKHIVIPAHYLVKTYPLNLTSHTTFQVDGSLIAMDSVENWPIIPPVPIYGDSEDNWHGWIINQYQPFVYAANAVDVRITGTGVIDGSGPYWWDLFDTKDPVLEFGGRPNLIQTVNVTGLELDTVTLKDSPFWTVHPILSRNIYIHHLKIRAPMYAPNVDGIDPDACQNVLVEYNDVACGDDHIAIKAGVCGLPPRYINHCMDAEWQSRSAAYLTKNITIRHNIFKTGMGIAIGSESSGSIQDVYIYNNTIGVCEAGHDDKYKSCGWGPALHLKTTITRSGTISNIQYDNNTIYNTSMFIFLETNYQTKNKDLPPDYPMTKVENIYFRNNRALGRAIGATFHCDKLDPCHEIYVLNNTIVNANPNHSPWTCNFIQSYHVADNSPGGLEECMAKSMNHSTAEAERSVSSSRMLPKPAIVERER